MSLNSDDAPRTRVLVVDDSAFMRTAISRMIACEPDMEVVGTAGCASIAFEKISALNPDVITLDLVMPGLDGLGTLRHIMAQSPRPVIMVSSLTEKDAETRLQALSAGAFDCVPKQLSENSLEIAHIRDELITKIRAAAQSCLTRTAAPDRRKEPRSVLPDRLAPVDVPALVAMGLSTGGPKALEQILPQFRADLPVPVLIVQHMPFGFTTSLAQRLNCFSSITVKEAAQGELITPGTAYLAPAGLHMRVVSRVSDSKPAISLSRNPEDTAHVPSIDELMYSVAKVFQNRAIGIIMTGMGSDGASGMTAIFRQGGITIGQDEASCAVYGMPRVCAQLGVLTRVLPLSDIPAHIVRASRWRRHA
ncbi:MAG TPA: chemotaxis response regulator protein-glutamate methylesterase [Candidatus Sulfotelmatobacter sp.]|nr:chemotaxis response regulator protein-glutamate methylesterase [Candidatus Sulfotelmatobacter sp.]